MNIARMSLVAAMLIGGCHPIPSFASSTGDDMRNSAVVTCSAAGIGDNEECINIIAGDYYDATMYGAESRLKGEKNLDSSQAVSLGIIVTGCDIKKPACTEHVTSWAAWYMYGKKRVMLDKELREAANNYYKG